MFIRPGSEKSCLSGLAPRKVGLRKAVYSAWVEEKLFIRPSSEKSWSEKSCLSGSGPRKVGRKNLFIQPGLEKRWSSKSCLSRLGRRKVGPKKVV